MKVEIEVVSRETIKPSSPTPDHLRHYQLSYLDQTYPPVFMPMVFFYPKDSKLSNIDKSNHLKKHLSESLTQFYPLAGRCVDNLYVDCNDEGVPYVEARVSCPMSELISDPIPGDLNKLHPYELDDVRDLLMAIQINFFDCGGIAVSVGISHVIADALSYFMFVNNWAATARGDSDVVIPKFESASLFPPRVDGLSEYRRTTGIAKDNIVAKRFVFSASKIALLRDKYTNINKTKTSTTTTATAGPRPTRPTRVEALSAFLWSRFMASTQEKADRPNKIHTLLQGVNLRTRMEPPLPGCYFGNISRFAIAAPSAEEEEEVVVNRIREAIRKIDGDYVAKLREDAEAHLNFMKERAAKVTKGEIVSFSCTSLCRMPLYGADFGWGKPIWVGSARLTFKNLVVFIDTQSGDGIEAWVNLQAQDMAKFEVDQDLLALTLPSNQGCTLAN